MQDRRVGRDGCGRRLLDEVVNVGHLKRDLEVAHEVSRCGLPDLAVHGIGHAERVDGELEDGGHALPATRRRAGIGIFVELVQVVRTVAQVATDALVHTDAGEVGDGVLHVGLDLDVKQAVPKVGRDGVGPRLVGRAVASRHDVAVVRQEVRTHAMLVHHLGEDVLHRHGGLRHLVKDQKGRLGPVGEPVGDAALHAVATLDGQRPPCQFCGVILAAQKGDGLEVHGLGDVLDHGRLADPRTGHPVGDDVLRVTATAIGVQVDCLLDGGHGDAAGLRELHGFLLG